MQPHLNDARLLAVARLVRKGSVVADIGTDHGKLVCYLVGTGTCPRGYACDIAEGPLQSAKSAIMAAGLGDRVEAVLTDGLKGLPLHEIDDIVIAGMGGELIAEIIAASHDAKDGRLRWILQPMTKAERLRQALYRMGYVINEEHGVRQGEFLYTVMAVQYTDEIREVGESFAWAGRLPESTSPESRELLDKIRARLREITAQLEKSTQSACHAKDYREILAQIDKMIPED